MRRADVKALCRGPDDRSLSAVGGLVAFNGFLQRERFGAQLARRFGHLILDFAQPGRARWRRRRSASHDGDGDLLVVAS